MNDKEARSRISKRCERSLSSLRDYSDTLKHKPEPANFSSTIFKKHSAMEGLRSLHQSPTFAFLKKVLFGAPALSKKPVLFTSKSFMRLSKLHSFDISSMTPSFSSFSEKCNPRNCASFFKLKVIYILFQFFIFQKQHLVWSFQTCFPVPQHAIPKGSITLDTQTNVVETFINR